MKPRSIEPLLMVNLLICALLLFGGMQLSNLVVAVNRNTKSQISRELAVKSQQQRTEVAIKLLEKIEKANARPHSN